MSSSKQAVVPRSSYKYLDIITTIFITVLLVSNLLSSAKVIDLGVSIGSLALVFDAGTLVFPISYIFGDILTEIYGYRRSRRVIWSGFLATAMLGFFVWITGLLPGEGFWQDTVGQSAYDSILGGVSGLVVASLAAYLVGEFANSYVLARMKVAMRGRFVWMRTIASTLVGQGVDTIIFFIIATALGVFPPEIFVALIVTNYILKVGIEVIMTPLTVTLIAAVKRAENEDVYDASTNFNPFRLDA